MIDMTPQQMTALAQIWKRDHQYMTLEQFMETAKPTFYMDDAIVVPWCGMWLAVEANGYVHS